MIIIGYQGIGKSTLSNGTVTIIDLESGNFWVDGKRDKEWYKAYCNIAEHLSMQGYIVFVSSHKEVRERLKNSIEEVFAIVPALELKDEWIKKLEERYKRTGLEKDYKAFMNAKDRYEENINEIIDDCKTIFIKDMKYRLEEIVMGLLFAKEILIGWKETDKNEQ